MRGAGISVAGLPFGIGKNGNIGSGSSTWTLKGDKLSIVQKMRATFKVALCRKTYTILADSSCKRGTDVAELIRSERRIAERP
jgi:hypothetical protein